MRSPIKDDLKRILTGISIPQEYVCVPSNDLMFPMRVYLTSVRLTEGLEVTKTHLFLGYKPLVIALNHEQGRVGSYENEICLHFGIEPFEANTRWQDYSADSRSVARLVCRKTAIKHLDKNVLYLFEGVHGGHALIRPFHQWINRQIEKTRVRREGNIDLPGNLYDQVRIAYSIPRKISIVTVSNGQLINMFPTDLHGAIGETFYCGSLRVGGEVNRLIEEYDKIVISDINCDWYRQAYALGKNHMKGLQPIRDFPVYDDTSEKFGLPLPEGVVKYRELKRIDSIDLGIHRIHFYSTVSIHSAVPQANTLAHIHQYYLQWRKDHGLQTSYLLR